MRMEKACKTCGEKFTVSPSRYERTKFCSLKCRKKYNKEKTRHICACCGSVFFDTPSVGRKYCSAKCSWEDKRHNIIKHCLSCNKEFVVTLSSLTRKYCSRECYDVAQNNKDEKLCLFCGKPFLAQKHNYQDRKYCSRECAFADRQPTKEAENNFKARRTKRYQEWRLSVLERDKYTCQQCGSKKNIEAHHVKQFAFYKKQRYDINNGMALCHDCHKKVHYGNYRQTSRW